MSLLLLAVTNPKIMKKDYNKSEIDIELKGKSIHIVFVADSAPSIYMYHVAGANGLNYQGAARQAEKVNNENHTGTLHPDFAVTLLPLSVFNNRNDLGDRKLMKKHIEDVFEANRDYIKLEEIFFCIEQRPDFDRDLALEVISELVNEGHPSGALIISHLY